MEKIKRIIKKLPAPLKNKYIITSILFIFWILFLDDYNMVKQRKIQNNINELEKQKEFYISEKRNDSIELNNLKNNEKEQERFAREKFMMKKENEDLFIIRNKKDD